MTRIGCLCALVVGCARPAADAPPANGPSQYAELRGLKATTNADLQGELASLEQENGTPMQLSAARAAVTSPADAALPPIVQIERAFPLLGRQLLASQIAAVYPAERVRLGPGERERAREILRRQAQPRENFRLALQPRESGLGVPLDRGLLVSLEFLEPYRIGCRLELLDAADDLSEHRLENALEPLEVLLRACRRLAAEKNLSTRLAAVELRVEALRVLKAIAGHRFAAREKREQLLGLVNAELAAWPADADAWIGERAAGLHTYELVRGGDFLSLLAPQEIARLEQRGILKATSRAALQQVDADELFYLQSMRQMIAASRLPYFQRAPVLAQLRRELAAREQTAEYPLIAATVLLTDFEQAHLQQAEDRARMEAWQLALSLVVQQTRDTPATINSLTGQPFMVQNDGQRIVVSGILLADEQPITLRFLPEDRPFRSPLP